MRRRSSRHKGLRIVRAAMGFLFIGMVFMAAWFFTTLPDISSLAEEDPGRTALMQHRERMGIGVRQFWVPLSEMAPELQHAVIVAEDAKFWQHRGLDWESIREAFKKNWEEKKVVRGGSTITQQLAKNLYLNPSRDIGRKFRELFIALRMEQKLSKPRILEIYLNVVEWGRGVYGAEAAARHYFKKSARHLTVQEAAWLAAILPSPLVYDQKRDSQYIRKRADRIAYFVERRLNSRPGKTKPSSIRSEGAIPESRAGK